LSIRDIDLNHVLCFIRSAFHLPGDTDDLAH
jgi:hypothetical protein